MTAIRWIETDTGTNIDISTAAAVGSYTADADRVLLVQSFINQVAGGGDYTMYIKIQIGGAGATYIVLPTTTMTAAAGETSIAGQSGWFTVRTGDIVTVYILGLAGDTTTPDYITRWFEDIGGETAADIWTYTTRTLTQSAVQVADIVSGSSITIQRGDSLSAALTGLGAITGYTTLDFTVKENKSDADTNAIIRIRKNASGLNDGLIRFNGAAATASDGSITINNMALGNITIVLAASNTDDLIPGQGYYYDIQKITGSMVLTMATGTFNVAADVTRLIT